MKKLNLKSQILLGALLLGAGAAGAHHVATLPDAQDPTYNWTRAAGSPEPGEMNPLLNATVEQAEENYGCSGDGDVCAIGQDPNQQLPNETINFNQ